MIASNISCRQRRILRILSVLILALVCSACEQTQPDHIQWQLPLEAPDDLHGGQQFSGDAPEWATARNGEAELVWLQKSTTRLFHVRLALGGMTQLQGWDVRLLGLATGLRIDNGTFLNDKNVDNAAALVEISRDGKLIYRGWLYEKFPELFGMDDPEWKVWLKGIMLEPASEQKNNLLP
jgi:hypothetical protein